MGVSKGLDEEVRHSGESVLGREGSMEGVVTPSTSADPTSAEEALD